MNRNKLNFLVTLITFITLGYLFSGGDCGTETKDEPVPTTVAPPTNVKVTLDQASGSFAVISWTHSSDQTRGDFKGYRGVTYNVDSAGNILSQFNAVDVPKTYSSQIINSIIPLKRYRSYVTAELTNAVKSDSIGSKIYAPVFANNGLIDEYMVTGNAKSGFGWDTDFGVGIQYPFTSGNADYIDLHARDDGTGLRFYSPDQYNPGKKRTYFELVGQGKTAFDQTDLNEPSATSLAVIADNVYLLKLESGHYVKIWVKQLQTISGYRQISFDYKVQPVAGLRVLKH